MSLIRDRIIESAVRHFIEKGYAATSIQDISDDCGIAKGSLYKYFSSKEELFKEIHKSRQQLLDDQLEGILTEVGLTPREVFVRETEVTLEFFLTNKFIMQEIKELIKTKKEMAPFFLQMRMRLLDHHRKSLIRLLGEQITPHIWDIVTVYGGIIKEFNFLMIFENKPLRIRDIALFTVGRLEEMAAGILAKQETPILTDALMCDMVDNGLEGKRVSVEEQRSQLLDALLAIIKELAITGSRRAQLVDAALALAEEFARDQPKVVIIQALLSLLQQEHELSSLTLQLEKYVRKLKNDRECSAPC
ncbi:transcriptional regulator, TetR family [Paenibacillus algorifonticola]|uniref:Transcriptional regulator, TetR family n=1 Tax=Paenibacillus algorifonticola TaxID=684063 RepID=A0A1I2DAP7_9BACL|nr:TetR/AcrR family transcriptional regulator [Paenibacillus algorifonticola]SFE77622.1 transcriptional regulator, TetR family [Paenibacillus algorifonticola]